MTRKGWNWREEPEDVTPETVTEIIKIHNFNNEKAWNEVNYGGGGGQLKKVNTHPEIPEIDLDFY